MKMVKWYVLVLCGIFVSEGLGNPHNMHVIYNAKVVRSVAAYQTTSGPAPAFDIKLSVICGPTGDYWTDTADEDEKKSVRTEVNAINYRKYFPELHSR